MSKHYFRAFLRDTANRVRYGRGAPRYGERIFVNASESEQYLPSAAVENQFGVRLRQASGLVINTWPGDQLRSVTTHHKVSICVRRWRDGLTWENAGAYDYMMRRIREAPDGRFDGCTNLTEVRARYARLDQLFMHLQSGGSFSAMEQLKPGNFREVGGVIFHIGPRGEPVFGGGGAHRFALAQILELTIPAQIGLVSRAAIPLLHRLRPKP